MHTRNIPYVELKNAYQTVKRFAEEQTGGEINSLQGDIEEQLGIAGDDTKELLIKFIKRFDLNAEGFEIDKHFYSEGELFGSGPALANLVILIIKVSMWLIEVLSFKQIKFNNKPEWYRPSDRELIGLTFKQMLTWYMEKDFKKANSTFYKLALGY
jgi:hypothetical protein